MTQASGFGAAIPFEFGRGTTNTEGAKMFPVVFDFTVASASPISLQTSFRDINLNTISTIYIDNADNTFSFKLTFTGTGHTITAAANTQGFFPVLCPPGILNCIASSASTSTKTTVMFINQELMINSWKTV